MWMYIRSLRSCVSRLTIVNFSNSGCVDTVVLYGVADKNARLHLHQHLGDYGTFKPQTHDRDRDRTESIVQAKEQILERVEEEPDISTRQLAAEIGVSQFVVHPTIKEQALHPYHVQKVQSFGVH